MSEPVRRVAVVGDDDDVMAALRASDATVVDAPAAGDTGGDTDGSDTGGADAVLATDERALREAATGTAPVLPVGTGRYAVPVDAVGDAVDQVLAGESRRVAHPQLDVSVAGDIVGRALFDVGLVTAEPARISEYGVRFADDTERTFRADAVVVATPLGSDGYAAAAGGPMLSPDTGLSVVPVAPFSTSTETWVAAAPVELAVERDEEPVSLVLDGEEWGEIPPHEPVVARAADRVDLLSVPAARSGP